MFDLVGEPVLDRRPERLAIDPPSAGRGTTRRCLNGPTRPRADAMTEAGTMSGWAAPIVEDQIRTVGGPAGYDDRVTAACQRATPAGPTSRSTADR